MFDSNFITILFNVSVVKLFAIITSNLLDLHIKLILGILGKLLEDLCNFGVVLQEGCPSVPGVIINYDLAIFFASKTSICGWSK